MTKEAKEESADSRPTGIYDVRYLERAVKRGVLSRKDVEKYLKSLPDSKDKAVMPPGGDRERT